MTRDHRQEPAAGKFTARLHVSSATAGRRPRRTTALTALPDGGTGAGRAYGLAELDESRDRALSCALCGGIIEPGSAMTYYAETRGGFGFYHPSCADVPEALA